MARAGCPRRFPLALAFAVAARLLPAAAAIRLVVVGGGAAGFFGATRAASLCPQLEVLLLEGSPKLLTKVSVSGGGRCNVCHDEAKERAALAANYPRGERTMLNALSHFGAADAADWFRGKGVELKTEADGRMFPTTDSSSTIVNALRGAADDAGVQVLTRAKVLEVAPRGDDDGEERFEVVYSLADGGGKPRRLVCGCRSVLLATGGSADGHRLLTSLQQPLVTPVPSLFTLRLANPDGGGGGGGVDGDGGKSGDGGGGGFDWRGLAGLSVETVRLRLCDSPALGDGAPKPKPKRKRGAAVQVQGPLLFTHRGISGPGVLRLSAFAARHLAAGLYRAEVQINWVGMGEEEALAACAAMKQRSARRAVELGAPGLGLPKRLWARLVASAAIAPHTTWAEVSKAQLRSLAKALSLTTVRVTGKDMNKEEFVTAGGAELKGIDPRRFESRVRRGLFLAGEVVDIDGVTGGFNFQNAWTSSWLAGTAIAEDANSWQQNAREQAPV